MAPWFSSFQVPEALQELLPGEVVAGLALGLELALHHHLGGDAGVVDAGNPEGVEALGPLEAREGVVQGEHQGMAHVQVAGDVGGRDDDGPGLLAALGPAFEDPGVLPGLVPAGLRGLEVEGFVHFSHGGFLVRFDSSSQPGGDHGVAMSRVSRDSAVPGGHTVTRTLEVVPECGQPLASSAGQPAEGIEGMAVEQGMGRASSSLQPSTAGSSRGLSDAGLPGLDRVPTGIDLSGAFLRVNVSR